MPRSRPSFTTKRGVRYFFYVSAALLRGGNHKAGSLPRIAATALEQTVMNIVRQHSGNPDGAISDRDRLDARVERIVVGKTELKLELKPIPEDANTMDAPFSAHPSDGRYNSITIPWSPDSTRPLVQIDERATESSLRPDPGLVQAVARAHAWIQQLSDGTHNSIEELAGAHGLHAKVVRKAIRLGFLAPDIVAEILAGDRSPTARLSASESELPLSWVAQRHALKLDL